MALLPLLFVLLLCHLIGDFLLQTDGLYRLKITSHWGVLIHVVIHLAVTALLLANWSSSWSLLLVLGVLHYVIDVLKLTLYPGNSVRGFVIDQVAHLAVLVLLAWIWYPHIEPILPLPPLRLSLLYASVPALLVFLWVILDNSQRTMTDSNAMTRWAHANLLQFARLVGLPLLLFLAIFLLGVTLPDVGRTFFVQHNGSPSHLGIQEMDALPSVLPGLGGHSVHGTTPDMNSRGYLPY